MPLLTVATKDSPVLANLASAVPPQTPMAVAGVSDPIADLVISPADGRVLRPGESGFDDLLPFNLRTTTRPLVIAQCFTANGVSLAIKWAHRHQIQLCPHAGGHSYEGFSSCSGIMIDVRKMDSITIDASGQTARIGAGCLLGNVAVALFAKKFALPAGSCRPVGVAGLTQGGGHGLTSRKFGLTCDNLLAALIVDANGNELNVGESENPDLFWALRGGGGGNFGIVTEFTFKIHPVNIVIAFTILWPTESAAAEIIKAWQSMAQSAPDELTFLLHVGGNAGKIHLSCSGLYLPREAGETPSVDELKTLLRPLLSLGGALFHPRPISYLDAVKLFAGDGDPNRVYFKGKSDYAVALWSDEVIEAFLAAVRATPAPIATIFESYGGAVNRIGESDTAFPHRGNTLFCLQYFLQWTSTSSTNRCVAAIRGLYNAMRPHLPGYSYVNYLDADLPDYPQAYYKGNLPRLQAIKRQYDPENVFHFAQSIPLPVELISMPLA